MTKFFRFSLFLTLLVICTMASAQTKALYAVGAFQGWDAENMTEFEYVDGLYTLDIDVTNSELEFKISTGNGSWESIDAGVYGIESALENGVEKALKAGITSNIVLPWAGYWTITVAGDFSTITVSTEDPEPFNPLYVLGNVNGQNWNTSAGVEFSHLGNKIYEIANVTVDNASNGYGYFTFVTVIGSSWDIVNTSTRYGALTKDEAISLNVATGMTNNWGAGSQSWKIAAGDYKMVVDLKALTVTVSEATAINDIEFNESVAPVYYNLQGVEVENPTNGLYIVKRGNKVTKEIK